MPFPQEGHKKSRTVLCGFFYGAADFKEI